MIKIVLVQDLNKGEDVGHPFRGNQWTGARISNREMQKHLARERDRLFEYTGQSGKLRDGISRKEGEEYFKKVELWRIANSNKYAYAKPGTTIADSIDEYMDRGYVVPVKVIGGYRLHKVGSISDGVSLGGKEGVAYMKLMDMYHPGFIQKEYTPSAYPPNGIEYKLASWQESSK